MLVAAFAALILQQTPPGAVAWDAPPAPEPIPERAATPMPSTLPDWALADPFAWERSQCSSPVRGQTRLGACQVRVRAELAAHLGDALPAALRPTGLQEDCVPTAQDDDSYGVSCTPQRREAAAATGPREQICETRPQRQGGAVAWTETCRSATGEPAREGLSRRLFGRD